MVALKDYEKQLKENPDNIQFNPKELGITGAKFWEKQ